MKHALVIFDFDGTIADSRYAILQTAQVALETIGEPPVAEEEFGSRIGLPLGQIFAEIRPRLDEDQLAAVVAAYRASYAEISRAHTTVFDGMLEILDDLHARGSTLAIATGKSTRGAHLSIERMKLDPTLFACIVGTDAVANPKPHPDMVVHICSELGFARENAVVVGDTTFDIEMSVAAGVECCGVTWGSHSKEQLCDAGATWVVHTRTELAELLAQ